MNNEISSFGKKDDFKDIELMKNKVLVSPTKLQDIHIKDDKINELKSELDQLRANSIFNTNDILKESIEDLNKKINKLEMEINDKQKLVDHYNKENNE